jgi:hypothetical protein
MNTDQLPPFDTEAEAAALACVLISNGKAEELLDLLTSDDFYDIRHRTIFRALRALRSDDHPIDESTVGHWLMENKEVERAGGLPYLAGLPNLTPSALNFDFFLKTVREKADRRAALRDATELSRVALDTSLPTSAISIAARRMAEAYIDHSDLPDLVDASAFMSDEIVKPSELIFGIVHKGSKLVLGGGSKSFKTWTLLDLALSVSHGQPWLEHETSPGRVLYCNFEIQPWSWQCRLKAVASARGITIEPNRLSLWNLRGKAANFNLLLPKICEIAKNKFSLIVLDPIYKLYGEADENKASDVARLLNGIEDLTVDTGATVAFGAHFSKGNQASKESIDRISGSGVFARDPDSLLIFTKHETEDAFTVEATLRNFEPLVPFVVRWKYPLMVPDNNLDPSRLKQVKGRPKTHAETQLLEALNGDRLTTTEWQSEAEDEYGISRTTFFELKKSLEISGKVRKSKIDEKWEAIKQ